MGGEGKEGWAGEFSAHPPGQAETPQLPRASARGFPAVHGNFTRSVNQLHVWALTGPSHRPPHALQVSAALTQPRCTLHRTLCHR